MIFVFICLGHTIVFFFTVGMPLVSFYLFIDCIDRIFFFSNLILDFLTSFLLFLNSSFPLSFFFLFLHFFHFPFPLFPYFILLFFSNYLFALPLVSFYFQ